MKTKVSKYLIETKTKGIIGPFKIFHGILTYEFNINNIEMTEFLPNVLQAVKIGK